MLKTMQFSIASDGYNTFVGKMNLMQFDHALNCFRIILLQDNSNYNLDIRNYDITVTVTDKLTNTSIDGKVDVIDGSNGLIYVSLNANITATSGDKEVFIVLTDSTDPSQMITFKPFEISILPNLAGGSHVINEDISNNPDGGSNVDLDTALRRIIRNEADILSIYEKISILSDIDIMCYLKSTIAKAYDIQNALQPTVDLATIFRDKLVQDLEDGELLLEDLQDSSDVVEAAVAKLESILLDFEIDVNDLVESSKQLIGDVADEAVKDFTDIVDSTLHDIPLYYIQGTVEPYSDPYDADIIGKVTSDRGDLNGFIRIDEAPKTSRPNGMLDGTSFLITGTTVVPFNNLVLTPGSFLVYAADTWVVVTPSSVNDVTSVNGRTGAVHLNINDFKSINPALNPLSQTEVEHFIATATDDLVSAIFADIQDLSVSGTSVMGNLEAKDIIATSFKTPNDDLSEKLDKGFLTEEYDTAAKIVAHIEDHSFDIGMLDDLITTNKTNLVEALNEVYLKVEQAGIVGGGTGTGSGSNIQHSTDLLDMPNAFVDAAGKFLVVKPTSDGYMFSTLTEDKIMDRDLILTMLNEKQDKIDQALITNSKNVVTAINELKTEMDQKADSKFIYDIADINVTLPTDLNNLVSSMEEQTTAVLNVTKNEIVNLPEDTGKILIQKLKLNNNIVEFFTGTTKYIGYPDIDTIGDFVEFKIIREPYKNLSELSLSSPSTIASIIENLKITDVVSMKTGNLSTDNNITGLPENNSGYLFIHKFGEDDDDLSIRWINHIDTTYIGHYDSANNAVSFYSIQNKNDQRLYNTNKDIVVAINENTLSCFDIRNSQGNLSSLVTDNKDSIVNSINSLSSQLQQEITTKITSLDNTKQNREDLNLQTNSKNITSAINENFTTIKAHYDLQQIENSNKIDNSEKGVTVATLTPSGTLSPSQLPIGIDPIVEYPTYSNLPPIGSTHQIYHVLENGGKSYRWSGTTYTGIDSGSIVIGTVTGTAFDGGKGTALETNQGDINSLESSLGTDIVSAINTVNTNLSTKQDKTDSTLQTSSKTVSGAINELNLKIINGVGGTVIEKSTDLTDMPQNLTGAHNKILTVNATSDGYELSNKVLTDFVDHTDLTPKQNIIDSSFKTSSKTVPGAINELFDRPADFDSIIDGASDTFDTLHKLEHHINLKVDTAEKGVNNGVATLDANGKIHTSQLPSSVDDIQTFPTKADLDANSGQSGVIYVVSDTNKVYRWTGDPAKPHEYIEMPFGLALGETTSSAFAGNRGKLLEVHQGDLSTLKTTIKTNLVGAINELNDRQPDIAAELLPYQKHTDTTLTTIDKTIVGSINEMNDKFLEKETDHIAIGLASGQTNKGDGSISIGADSGKVAQKSNSIAIGKNSGSQNQNIRGIALGFNSASSSQGIDAISIGTNSGNNFQSDKAIAIGDHSAISNQGNSAIAIGVNSGQSNQGRGSIALGPHSGNHLEEYSLDITTNNSDTDANNFKISYLNSTKTFDFTNDKKDSIFNINGISIDEIILNATKVLKSSDLTDMPTYDSHSSGNVLAVNSAGDAIELTDISSFLTSGITMSTELLDMPNNPADGSMLVFDSTSISYVTRDVPTSITSDEQEKLSYISITKSLDLDHVSSNIDTIITDNSAIKNTLTNIQADITKNQTDISDTSSKLATTVAVTGTNRTLIDANIKDIADHKVIIDKNTTDITANAHVLLDHNTKIDKNTSDINDLQTEHITLETKVDDNTTAITQNSDEITNINTYVTDLTTELNTQVSRIDTNETGITDNKTAIDANALAISGIHGSGNVSDIPVNAANIALNVTAIAANKTAIDLNTADLDTANQIVSDMDARVVANNSNIALNKSHLASEVLKLDKVIADTTVNATNITKNTTDITHIKTQTAQVTINDTAIKKNIADIITEKGRIDKNITDIATNVTDIKTNTDDITQLKSDVTANTGHITTNTTGVKDNKDNLAAEVLKLDKVITDTATNTTHVSTNTHDIATNKTNIAHNVTAIATNKTEIASKESDINKNQTDIHTLRTDLTHTTTNITTNTHAIAAEKTKVDKNVTDIAKNVTDIEAHRISIATNKIEADKNKADIAINVTNIADNASDISDNSDAITINVTGVSTNAGTIATNRTDINKNATDITTIHTDITGVKSDVSTNATHIGTNTSSISDLTTVVEGNKVDAAADTQAVSVIANTNRTNLADEVLKVTKNTTDIAHLTTSVHTNTTDIAALHTSVSQSSLIHLSDVDMDGANAPTNGQIIGYQNGHWVAVDKPADPDGSAVIPEAPNDGKTYGRKNESWSEVIVATSHDLHAPASGSAYTVGEFRTLIEGDGYRLPLDTNGNPHIDYIGLTIDTDAISAFIEKTSEHFYQLFINYPTAHDHYALVIANAEVAGAVIGSKDELKFYDLKTQTKTDKIALGENSGEISQGTGAISIGINAGHDTQGEDAIAIGHGSGTTNQGIGSVAIGKESGDSIADYDLDISSFDSRSVKTKGFEITYKNATKEFDLTNSTGDAVLKVNGNDILEYTSTADIDILF